MKKENPNIKKTKFDQLASDLTVKERKDLLNRVNPSGFEKKDSDSSGQKNKSEKEKIEETKRGLELQFKREPVFTKIIIWIKSFFMNISVEEVYNNAVVASIARRIEVLYPDLLNYRQKTLCEGMYREIGILLHAQDFFAMTLKLSELDSGVFYYLLCRQLFPDYSEVIKKSCDPFQMNFARPMGQEARNNFLNRLDECLTEMPPDMKEKIASASRSFEWLKMFVKLPLNSMLNKFTSGTEGRSCMFVQLKNDFHEFSKILSSKIKLADDFITSLLFTSGELKDFWKCDSPSFSQEDITRINENASAETMNINMFSRKYPLRDLGKVINENSIFVPETFSPSENWFAKFREQWRIVFDQRWRLWNREYKKEEIKKKIKLFFGLNDFQKFPYHPWKKIEGEFQIRFDLSLGFINFYLKQEYSKYMDILNVITLEGDFQIKENRREFTDLIADFNEIMNRIDVLVGQVSLSGEYGSEFMRYESSIKAKSNREKIKLVLDEIEGESSSLSDGFINDAQKFEKLASAMLGEYATVYYGPLTNLNRIMGRDNGEFRASLSKLVHSMKHASEIMADLKGIDTFKV